MFETLSRWKQTPWSGECLKPWAGCLNETLSGLTEWNPERVDWMKPWAGRLNETLSRLTEWNPERVDWNEILRGLTEWNPEQVNKNALSGWMFETLSGWKQIPWVGECLNPLVGENKHRNRRKMETNEWVKTNTLSGWMFETLSGWKQTPWAGECLNP